MFRISIDVMGNDQGIKPIADAVLEFGSKNLNFKFILVGDRKKILTFIEENEKIEILDIKKTVEKDSKAASSRDFTTSMAEAIKLVKNNEADAVLSSGASAAYLTNCVLILKRIENMDRPAFLTILPTINGDKKTILLDCGANVQVTAKNLVQWAKLAKIFSEVNLNVKKPVLAILNIGSEQNKGLEFHQEANKILESDEALNYIGFVEPNHLLDGVVDVAVVDGYGGNLILKTMEGTAMAILKILKQNIKKSPYRKLLALGLKNTFIETKDKLDYRNVGSAWVIGVKGVAIKAHGASDKKAYLGALNQISIALENNFLNKVIKES